MLRTREHGPRILFAIPTLSVGGAENRLRAIAPRHAAQGLPTALFTRLSASDAADLRSTGLEVMPITAGNHSPQLLVEAVHAIRRFQPDIIYSWITQCDVIFGALHALSPSWRWVMAEASSAPSYKTGWKASLRLQLGQHADGIIANSPAGAAMWQGQPRVVTIANGIDYERFSTAEPADTGLCHAPIVAVCRLIPTKRVDLLIDALTTIRTQRRDATLLIVGDGPERANLEAQVAGLGLQDAVRFLGFRADVPRWFRAAAVVASASEVEGQSNSTMEAAAAGAPLVLTDIAAHRDTFGPNAAYVPTGNAAAMAEAILRDLDHPEAAAARAARAQAAMRRFTIDDTVTKHIAFFESLFESSSRAK